MVRLFLILLTVCLALNVTPLAAQSEPIDAERYLSLLREARAAAARGDQIDLRTAAEPLIDAQSVRMPSGASATVDNRWLAEALAGDNPNTRTIAERLGALIDAQALAGGVDAASAQATLDDILRRPPFDQPADAQMPDWLADFLTWLLEQLGGVAGPAVQGGVAGGNALSWVLAVGGIILIIAIIFFWLRSLRTMRVVQAAALDSDDPEANLTSADATQEANALARNGDYRRAVRYLYLASMIWLDERRVLRYERTLTNREHLARLAEQPQLRERLRPVVDTFDRVWYGSESLDAERFAAYEQQVQALRREEP